MRPFEQRHVRSRPGRSEDPYRVALTHYRQGIELHRRLGETQAEVRARLNMAQACVRLGRDDEASAIIRASLATAVDLRITWLQYLCLQTEADRCLTRGDTETGLADLGLFTHQAPAGSLDQNETTRILAQTSLSPDVIEAGMARGTDLDLDIVVHDLLAPGADPAGGP